MKPTILPSGLLLLALAACGSAETADAPAAQAVEAAVPAAQVAQAPGDGEFPAVLVYKGEYCGCCDGWIEHLRAAGFTVEARNVVDLGSIKRDAGVAPALSSCHTALVDGYVVEGHVPADVVKKLLAERPEVAGIAVPGMPVGSPGMEGPNAKPYDVLTFDRAGGSRVWVTVDPR